MYQQRRRALEFGEAGLNTKNNTKNNSIKNTIKKHNFIKQFVKSFQNGRCQVQEMQ